MREYEFRGIRLDNGEWIFGDLNQFDNRVAIGPAGVDDWIDVDVSTVGRYTEKRDKKGKKIYDGDILNVWFDDVLVPMLVTFDSGWKVKRAFVPVLYDLGREVCAEKAEVIGNIYDNPELMSGNH